MTLNEYQQLASRTRVYAERDQLTYPIFGLLEEAGEVSGQVKRMLRDDGGLLTPERGQKLVRELGDAMWYVAAIATDLGVDLDEVAAVNLGKLADRSVRGKLHGAGDDR